MTELQALHFGSLQAKHARDLAIIKSYSNKEDLPPEITLQIIEAFGGAKPYDECCAESLCKLLRPVKIKGIRGFQKADQRMVELVILPNLRSISTLFNVAFAMEERRRTRFSPFFL